MYEIYSYNGGEKAVAEYLSLKFNQLKSGGRLVARDIVGPEDKEVLFLTKGLLSDNVGTIAQQSISDRFNTYITNSKWEKGNQTSVHSTSLASEEEGFVLWKTSSKTAMEFTHRMEYCENWDAELAETYCFWSHTQWIKALENAGFKVIKQEESGEPATREITEDWLIKNRFTNNVEFLTSEWPVTHHILVAEKP